MWHDQACNLAWVGGAGEGNSNTEETTPSSPSASWLRAAAASQQTIMEEGTTTNNENNHTNASSSKNAAPPADDVGADNDNDGSVENVGQLLSTTKLSSNTTNDTNSGAITTPPTTTSHPATSSSSSSSDCSNINININQTLAQNIATEHRIFLRAILDLLTERDLRATELAYDIHNNGPNTNNTLKIGSLRKASHRIKGLWKMKYVEIRRGTFSYFDDSALKQKQGRSSSSISGQQYQYQHQHQLLRKDIPLKASTLCTCRAVKLRSVKVVLPSTIITSTTSSSSSAGHVFELRIQGGKRRLWMANTREERQSWMQAIHNACIGASVTRGDNFLEYQMVEQDLTVGIGIGIGSISSSSSRRNKKKKNAKQQQQQQQGNSNNIPINSPYKQDIERYLEVREATMHNAHSKEEYVLALFANDNVRGKETMTVPVQYIKTIPEDTIRNSSNNCATSPSTFHETEISSCVEQLWKDLLRDSVEINGEVLAGDSFHGPERIVGRLTQQILSLDDTASSSSSSSSLPLATSSSSSGKTSGNASCDKSGSSNSSSSTRITEAQAISYARDILLACDRTRSGGDSYFCAENLCLNRDLVVLCPSSTEAKPLSIQVSSCSQQQSNNTTNNNYDLEDISGWVLYRSKSGKQKRQYLVLSQGILTGYAEADPKPHEFLGKMILQGATISNSSSQKHVQKTKKKGGESTTTTGHTITITTKDGKHNREFFFEDEFDYLFWYDSLCKSASSYSDKDDGNQASNVTNGMNGNHKTVPTVDVVVNVCTEYKLCTLDPSGIESEDTWG